MGDSGYFDERNIPQEISRAMKYLIGALLQSGSIEEHPEHVKQSVVAALMCLLETGKRFERLTGKRCDLYADALECYKQSYQVDDNGNFCPRK